MQTSLSSGDEKANGLGEDPRARILDSLDREVVRDSVRPHVTRQLASGFASGASE